MVYTLRFFSLQNAVYFIILTYLVSALFTFCIQSVLKLKKNNSGSKRLRVERPRIFQEPKDLIKVHMYIFLKMFYVSSGCLRCHLANRCLA